MKQPAIFNLFATSPIGPLEEHMGVVYDCTNRLIPFFEAVLQGDWDEVEKLRRKIARLENKADIIKRDLRLHMPKGLFLPVPRSDLLDLLTTQDRVANKAKDIAGMVLGRKMTFPKEVAEQYMPFLKRCIDAAKLANKAIQELDELLETSFGGGVAKVVDDMIMKLAKIERDADAMEIDLRLILFNLEKDLPPVDVMFYYKIIEWTGVLADRAQEVGDKLQILLAR